MIARLLLVLYAVASTALGTAAPARADTVWSGIVIANKSDAPEAIPAELAHLEETLKSTFGYNQFKLLGTTTKSVVKGDENWSAATKYFSLLVQSKDKTASGYLVNLQLLQETKLLLETDAKLSRQNPLLIRGPQIGDGQLLVVLVVR